ncbi:MAG: NADH-quinone oxidoreductase subunit B family protein [Thermodesulfovibrio sp.]|nr:NADH-quinone oxidoreductase subunit B family protein [Thermodesulfovibrio sp.]MDW7998640.1 NADH-quinone oxidoreductase subunit B family protein [Thermodesulfovibrio sp.]
MSLLKKLAQKALKKSVWIFHVNTGACNGCDIELLDVLTPYYDIERFGMKAVSSPRHADALVISGPVTRPTVEFVKSVYEATPEPKIVIALGSCATEGGIWFDSYNVFGGVDKIIPVNLYIPGCPPRPEAILFGIAQALGMSKKKIKPLIAEQVGIE